MVEDDVDPVESAADDEADLYGVATWEQRTRLDRFSVTLHRVAIGGLKTLIVLLAVFLLIGIGGASVVADPAVGVLTFLSVIPAVALAGYVWQSDITSQEPLSLLVATFLLGVVTASFAALVNSVAQPLFAPLGLAGVILFFYLVVAPVEESVKLLAVRLYAYNDDRFDAVIDGAVYGAMAGLGFATIENALFIAMTVDDIGILTSGLDVIGVGGEITTIRALAGPGHVVFSAYAGYYLGLAKFNPGNRGPIIIRGVIVAAFVHATYNTTVGPAVGVIQSLTNVSQLAAFFVFVLLFVGGFGYVLYRKIEVYRQAYRAQLIESPSQQAGDEETEHRD